MADTLCQCLLQLTVLILTRCRLLKWILSIFNSIIETKNSYTFYFLLLITLDFYFDIHFNITFFKNNFFCSDTSTHPVFLKRLFISTFIYTLCSILHKQVKHVHLANTSRENMGMHVMIFHI